MPFDPRSPLVRYGTTIVSPPPKEVVPYDGNVFSHFLYKNGADPFAHRRVWRDSRLGSIFELEEGTPITLSSQVKEPSFSRNFEA